MRVDLEFDANAQAAPQSFRDAIQAAANIIDATFSDAITVNIAIGYGELTINGSTESLSGGAAESAAARSGVYGYSTIHGLLEGSLSADVASGALDLPNGASLQGATSITVWSAEQKALGLIAPNDPGLDGAAGFSASIPANLLVGVALHELAHAMGRVPGTASIPDVFDLFRYQAPGDHLFGDALPSAAAYFSLDGGQTDLADYGLTSDPADFLNTSGLTPLDPFNEFYSGATLQTLTPVDILQMEALGFHAASPPSVSDTSQTAPETGADFARDIVWQTNAGMASVWELNGSSASGYSLPSAAGWQIEDYGDFTGNGVNADLVLRNTSTGMVDIWTDVNGLMSGHDVAQVGLDWNIMGTADFNGDGKSDILWRNEQNGDVSIWMMNGNQAAFTWNPGQVGLEWRIVGAADYAGTGEAQILWRNAVTGEVDMWSFNPSTGQASGSYVATEGLEWEIVGSGDFFGDGKADILWRNTADGEVVIWEMNGTQVVAAQAIANLGEQWQVASVVDANGDGKDDIVWHDTGTGQIVLWEMNGFNVQQADVLGTVAAGWQPLNHHYDWV